MRGSRSIADARRRRQLLRLVVESFESAWSWCIPGAYFSGLIDKCLSFNRRWIYCGGQTSCAEIDQEVAAAPLVTYNNPRACAL